MCLKIVGLGNLIYPQTRHSVGINFVERIGKRLGLTWVKDKTCMGLVACGDGVVLVQPTTFMNENGKTVLRAVKKYNVQPNNLIAIHDDVETDLGKATIKFAGGAR